MIGSTTQEELTRLRRGEPPRNGALLDALTVGLDSLTGFLRSHYLESYLPAGGSKVKLVTGRPGSGKTHLSLVLLREAEALGYLTVRFSAKDVWLHDFRDIYLEILRQCEIENVLAGCAAQIIRELGCDPAALGEGQRFLDYLAERGEADALSKGEIRAALRRFFTRNPLLDASFAACCSLLTGDLLGYPLLESTNRELILNYLKGSKTVKPSQIRALGIPTTGITRFNARFLLRSLCELIHLAGHPGLLVVVDDLETLLRRGGEERIRYTKLRREDAYESIRQLIDDIDSMRFVLFLFCADRALLDDESCGMKSYQALWLRVQNEVVSTRFNRFADILDLDRYADETYDLPTLQSMARRLARTLAGFGIPAAELEATELERILERAEYGGVGSPYLINRAVLEGGGADA